VGYTWRVAEAAAEKLDHDPGAAGRGGAALVHVLKNAAATEGHTYMPWSMLASGAWVALAGAWGGVLWEERLLCWLAVLSCVLVGLSNFGCCISAPHWLR